MDQLIYNGSKSFSLCFKRKDIKISSPTFYLDRSKVPLVEQCKYLGTTISIKNRYLNLKRQLRKVYANANVLLRKFSKYSLNVKCYLFMTYCSNLYCALMWFNCTKTALTKLKVAYNNSLRRFMGLPWHNSASEMFVNLNIKSFGELLRVFPPGFRSRIFISRNFMLSSICNSSCSIYSKLWAWWQTLLYVHS